MILRRQRPKLEELIIQNLPKAFSELRKLLSRTSVHYGEFVILSGRMADFKKKARIGTTNDDYEQKEMAKIRFALLEFLDQIEDEDTKVAQEAETSSQHITNPILVICRNEADFIEMNDFFARLPFFDDLDLVITDKVIDVSGKDLLIFANLQLEGDKMEAEKAKRIALMEAFLKANNDPLKKPFVIHLGGFWSGRNNWLDKAHAANSKFALLGRIKEVVEFIDIYISE